MQNSLSTLNMSPYSALTVAIGAIVVFVCMMAVVYWILLIISYWKLFNKAGEKGWKCLIPLYNVYVAIKLTWSKKFFWIGLFLAIFIGLVVNSDFMSLFKTSDAVLWIFILLALASAIVIAIFRMIAAYRVCKSFGKSGGFAALWIILTIFYLDWIPLVVLAFGKSEYQGNVYLKAKGK